MGPAYAKSVRAEGHAPQATICFDPPHVVALGTQALDEVRRPLWRERRALPDPALAKKFKGARWALLSQGPPSIRPRNAAGEYTGTRSARRSRWPSPATITAGAVSASAMR